MPVDPSPDAHTPTPEEVAHLLALAGLPYMGTARLRRLIERADPVSAWRSITDPSVDPPPWLGHGGAKAWAAWRRAAADVDPQALLVRRGDGAAEGLTFPGRAGYPPVLLQLEDPPVLLFRRGDVSVLDGPTVGIVGTRRCTRYGDRIARELGRGLAAAGVAVVSGLAAGIDAAAHWGTLEEDGGRPVGVVGSGLDVVYPRRNRALWDQVGRRGYLCTEAPPGAGPEAWRFPERNRLIAALSDVLVVVESHASGGALITAERALELGRTVLAVPGPVDSSASAGTNSLLGSGAHPCTGVDDVLAALGLARAAGGRSSAGPEPPAGDTGLVLDALGWQPSTLEQLVEVTHLPIPTVVAAVAELEATGWIDRDGALLHRRPPPDHGGAQMGREAHRRPERGRLPCDGWPGVSTTSSARSTPWPAPPEGSTGAT